jgi:3-hydroxyacyl-[acyl-carrier-protein] dehydratase
MKPTSTLSLGPDTIQRLIPHRRPFLMVDTVEAYERGPRPILHAARHVSANEPVFEGHFPGLHLWPGVYTIEGMGQSANLLHIVWSLEKRWEEHGGAADDLLAALRNLDLGYRLQPGYRPELSARLVEVLGDGPAAAAARIGLSAAVDVKLLAPVFAGQRIDYRVTQTVLLDSIVRFEVEASVAGKAVARGVMTSTTGVPLPPSVLRGA